MKTCRTLVSAALVLLPVAAPADILSVAVGGGLWNTSPSGNFQAANDPNPVSVADHLSWGSEKQNYLFLTLEHPVPFLPNLRLRRTNFEHSGNGTASFVFNGQTYSGSIESKLSIAETDALLYWELLDNVVSLDLGIDIRNYDIDYRVASGSTSSSDSFQATLPLLYGMGGVSPMPGLLIGAEASILSLGGNGVVDYALKVSYTTDFRIGLEGGYRSQSLKLDDLSGYDADMTFKGVFGGVYLKF